MLKKLKQSDSQMDALAAGRRNFILEAVVGGPAFNLTNFAWLAGLIAWWGGSDSVAGLAASIPTFAGLVQIFSPFVFHGKKHPKSMIISFIAGFRILSCSVVLIPLLVSDLQLRSILTLVTLALAFGLLNLASPAASNWIQKTVPDHMKGEYFGKKDAITLIMVTVITQFMGFVLDAFKARGHDAYYSGFLVVFGFAAVLHAIAYVFHLKTEGIEEQTTGQSFSLTAMFRIPLSNKPFMKLVVLNALFVSALNIGCPMLSVYQVRYLDLAYKTIMAFGFLQTAMAVLAARLWGKYADRVGWVRVITLTLLIVSMVHLVWAAIVPGTLFLLPVVFGLAGLAWGGINIAMFNLPFLFSRGDDRKLVYIGFNAAVGGLCGIIVNSAGGQLLSWISGMNLQVAGIGISGIQFGMFISGLLMLTASLYAGSVLRREYEAMMAREEAG